MQPVRTAIALAILVTIVAVGGASQQLPTDLANTRFSARVTRVLDGDTIDVRLNTGRTVRVRIFGIDSPELSEPFGDEALRFTRVLIFSKDVVIDGREVDQYRRLVGTVQVQSVDAALALLKAGLACHFRRYSDDAMLEAGELTAKTAGLGFWATGVRKPRCAAQSITESRRSALTIERTFIGNTNSHLYHDSTCKNARCKNCTIKFNSELEARTAGFKAARDCLK